MLGLAAGLPDPLVGLAPDPCCAFDLVPQHRPQALGDVVAVLGVQVDGVQHRAVDVVLTLVEGAVADAHRARPFVALEVVRASLVEILLAAHPVHDLQRAVLVALEVGDVLDEVVGLPVQAERVQPPQREGRVAHPAEAVVPVAFAAGRLRQRGRRRGDERPRRHEREPLQRERRALQVVAPRMVGVVAVGEPVAPEMGRAVQVPLRLLGGVRPAEPLGPRQRAEAALAFLHRVTPVHAVALDAEPDVAEHAERDALLPRGVHRRRARGGPVAVLPRPGRAVGVDRADTLRARLDHRPAGGRRAVVEHRLADDLDLHHPLDAFHDAHQHVVRVVVGRRAGVARAVRVVVPGAHRERVEHPDPPLRGHPGGLDHVGPGDVAPARRDEHAVGPHAPAAGAAVEHRPEDRGRVEVGDAGPLDRAVVGDERPRVAVRQEPVCADRRERRVELRGPRQLRLARRPVAHHSVLSKRGRSTPAGSACSSSSLSRCAASVTSAAGRS